ncbi:PqqD family peptide modification chaperone [Emticicia sp. ODNR4P]|nr:PqqD family peptide modification chaperone [Emticicia sp. ODNR4P]
MERYTINTEKIMYSPLENKGVLFDVENNEYYSLNETMYKVFLGLLDRKSVNEIVDMFLAEYDISEEVCKSEIQKAIDIFNEKKILV